MSVTAVDWEQAACRTAPELFFGAEDEKYRARQKREAKARAVCARCPISGPCLEFQLRAGDDQRDGGIFGGLDGDERHALAREQDRPRLCGEELHVMDAANTYVNPDGASVCRACRRAAEGRKRAEQRGQAA